MTEAQKQKQAAWLRFLSYRLGVAVVVYIVAAFLYATLLEETDWYYEAIVPATAFLISTLGPKALRKLWGSDGE